MSRAPRFPNDTSDKWFFRTLGVIGIILLLVAGYPVLIRYYEKQRSAGLSAEQISNFDRWYSQKISIPPETLKIEPFTSQTLESVRAFDRLWGESETAARELLDARKAMRESQNAGGSTESLQVTASVLEWRERLAPLEPLMRAWHNVVRQPDYRIQVWFVPVIGTLTDTVFPTMEPAGHAQQVGGLVYLDALIHLETGDLDEAIDNAEALLRYTHTDRYCTGFESIFISWRTSNGFEIFERLVPIQNDLDQKKRLRLVLEQYRAQGVFRPKLEFDPVVVESAGGTYRARYLGLIPDFQNKTGYEILEESWRIRLEYWKQYILSQAQSLEEKQGIEHKIKATEKELSLAQGGLSRWERPLLKGVHRVNLLLLYRMWLNPEASEILSKQEAELRFRYEQLLEKLAPE